MKIGGYILIGWGTLLFLLNFIGLITMPKYAANQMPMIIMGIGLFLGGIYLINKAKAKKLDDERRQKEKDEWYGNK